MIDYIEQRQNGASVVDFDLHGWSFLILAQRPPFRMLDYGRISFVQSEGYIRP